MSERRRVARGKARSVRGLATGLVVAAAAVVLHACGDDGGPTEPRATPGFLAVRVATPAVASAGGLFRVSGPALDSVRAVTPYRVFASDAGTPRRVIAAGNLQDGLVFEFWVPDTGARASYSVEVLEVAARDGFAALPLDGFRADLIVR